MNCLRVILKPGIQFHSMAEIAQHMKKTLPGYVDEYDGECLDVLPWPACIEEPYFQLESEHKAFLQISFFIRDAWLYDEEQGVKIKEFVKEICLALETDEWWYSSEMQGDHYEEYSPLEIDGFLKESRHTMEFEESLKLQSVNGDMVWFYHDCAM